MALGGSGLHLNRLVLRSLGLWGVHLKVADVEVPACLPLGTPSGFLLSCYLECIYV